MNTELIKVARKAAKAWSKSDAYGQASEIISMLCDELEKNKQQVATPPTVKDVLLERWRGDTEAMAQVTLEAIYDPEDDIYVFDDGFMTSDHEEALDHEVARLNSPAEVEA